MIAWRASTTAAVRRLSTARTPPSKDQVIQELTRVQGVGYLLAIYLSELDIDVPAVKSRFFDDGIYSVTDLRQRAAEGYKLTMEQAMGLKHFDDFQQRIPRAEVAVFEAELKDITLKKQFADRGIMFEICGSYRRNLPTCGDIDVILTHPTFSAKDIDKRQLKSKAQSRTVIPYLREVVAKLETRGLLTDKAGQSDLVCRGASRLPGVNPATGKPYLHRKTDLKYAPIEQYWPTVFWSTGSTAFTIYCRQTALQLRMSLNEKGLTPLPYGDVPAADIPLRSEGDLFRALRIPYLAPHERTDSGFQNRISLRHHKKIQDKVQGGE
ncbi:hypothetical protein RI367_004146 [Sorochytrium milnesiophthora]